MPEKYICIHGHFYQPPRENPWLEEVELQESAFPFHDWNERITAECYAPNAASRILDRDSRIIDIVNNYSRISFNFGPTLLSWLEIHQPHVYEAVIEADRISRERYSGHGSALAQVYNHMIMPLANTRDKRTQVRWGIEDFRRRYGREPEGMWLAETAVDLETLDIMAEFGVKFTVLSPRQASRVRNGDGGEWEDVSGYRIDPTMPYLCNLPSGRDFALYFYDGTISKAVAFEGLLSSGETFVDRLMDGFSEERDHPQLVHIATDGETYGHHHRHGDMALAYALYHIENATDATVTIYGEHLEKNPPEYEVEIFENSSWSCVHGVERWRADCGCNTGMHGGWNQRWRAPLRDALNTLRDEMVPIYEKHAAELLKDPWAARDDYLRVVLDRSDENLNAFFGDQAKHELSEDERIRALKHLEMQRHAMLMFTSCGWFFDEISGIESTQVLGYAARAIQLAKDLSGADLEPKFKDVLAQAPSNIPRFENGSVVFEKLVKPGYLDFMRVGAHFAIASLFEDEIENIRIYCYHQEGLEHHAHGIGALRHSAGRTKIVSGVTREAKQIGFAAVYLGGHNAVCGITRDMAPEALQAALGELDEAFEKSDIPEMVRILDKHFEKSDYSLWHLFKDEQRKVVEEILSDPLRDLEEAFSREVEQYYNTMQFLAEIGHPLPKALALAAEISLNMEMMKIFDEERPNTGRIVTLCELVNGWDVPLEGARLGLKVSERVVYFMERIAENPCDVELIEYVNSLVHACNRLPAELDFWLAQNIYFHIAQRGHEQEMSREERDCRESERYKNAFRALGEALGVKAE